MFGGVISLCKLCLCNCKVSNFQSNTFLEIFLKRHGPRTWSTGLFPFGSSFVMVRRVNYKVNFEDEIYTWNRELPYPNVLKGNFILLSFMNYKWDHARMGILGLNTYGEDKCDIVKK